MPDVITVSDSYYERPVEKLLGCKEEAFYPMKSSYTVAGNPIAPGMVAVLLGGEWNIADVSTADGAFTGLFYTHFDTTVGDEGYSGMVNPVVLVGPGVVKVAASSLGTSTWATSGSDVVELVAVAGELTLRTNQTTPTVAHLLKVNTDGSIEIELLQPNSNMAAVS